MDDRTSGDDEHGDGDSGGGGGGIGVYDAEGAGGKRQVGGHPEEAPTKKPKVHVPDSGQTTDAFFLSSYWLRHGMNPTFALAPIVYPTVDPLDEYELADTLAAVSPVLRWPPGLVEVVCSFLGTENNFAYTTSATARSPAYRCEYRIIEWVSQTCFRAQSVSKRRHVATTSFGAIEPVRTPIREVTGLFFPRITIQCTRVPNALVRPMHLCDQCTCATNAL